MATPNWQAARNGLPGDSNAVDKSAQINQFLGTHASMEIYYGKQVVTPDSGEGTYWALHTDDYDYDQPFTMSGTTIGRVAVPILPVGNGADLQVSLCADSSGSPGTVLATTRIPAKWITSLAGVVGSGPSDQVFVTPDSGPLATAQFNAWDYTKPYQVFYQWPAVDASGGASNASVAYNGNYMIVAGGSDSGGAATPYTFTAPWQATQLGSATPQPALPVATTQPGIMTTPDTVVIAGGAAAGTGTTNVFTASWDPNSGTIGSWSAQAALPQPVIFGGVCSYGETVYVLSGLSTGGLNSTNTYWATVSNGQITAWNSGPPLPLGVQDPIVGVVAGYLIFAGGQVPGGGSSTTAVYYSKINADGSLSSWQRGPSMLVGAGGWLGNGATVTDSAIIQYYPGGTGGMLILPFTAEGPGSWQFIGASTETGPWASAIFPASDGTFSLIGGMGSEWYWATTAYPMPLISVPLPASGLTNGATYHILLQQQGGDLNNYLRSTTDPQALPGDPTLLYRTRGAGSWTPYTSEYAIPIAVYDKSIGGQVWHTWEDSGNRISTLVYATTPDVRLLGAAESVLMPDGTCDACAWAAVYDPTWPAAPFPVGVQQL